MPRNSNIDQVDIVQTIRIISVVGKGTEADPVRTITEYYDMDGILLSRKDSFTPINNPQENCLDCGHPITIERVAGCLNHPVLNEEPVAT